MKTAGRFASFALVSVVALGALATGGCSRNNIEAVNLAIEADKVKSTNVDEAISKYEQATTLDPTNHRIMWKLALAYTKKEQWDKVASTCLKAQKVAPTFANYYFQQGMALARQAAKAQGGGNWNDAKGPLEEAIQKDPGLWDAHFELAEVLLHLDDEQGALREYQKAIEAKPDELAFYIPLADLYLRLGYIDEGEKVVREGLSFGKEGDKFLFGLHSLLGQVYESRQPPKLDDALKEYELAKRACGQCTEPGQQIAFFNLGAAYAQVSPPQTSQAMQNLQAFQKMICKGAAAARYADQCSQAQQLASKMGGTLQ
ncbi:MAG: tetratricopeptide repeat protein [Myxococcales bacterium]|jgi:tetratricopeptide (TPR) repeat protein|nr:tetratricopeptide repeat protein [Myxococcales bacterium]